ncbi:hypothetical protein Q2T76_01535 [Lactobacillus sp. YT155]|uniref:hypothetical protein n=1 Tax=Lactobacillus sp. YT155 TaxID=3060955 RepID=UPI00265F8C84|nr:hypothetical protein [Lactobacillus sp. YT155]MDO1604733.1 hypothetical protein [Lactobacillus sp. YT155]
MKLSDIKKSLNEAFIILGMCFLASVVISFFTPNFINFDMEGKIFLLVIFVGLFVVDLYRSKKKKSTSKSQENE